MEFAFVLPVLLALVTGILVYGIVFITQQAVAFAAERGADAVVSVDPDAGNYQALADTGATSRVDTLLLFLPGGADTTVAPVGAGGEAICGGAASTYDYSVTVTYSFAQWGIPELPFLPLPGTITGVGCVSSS